jgi:hypothetical protein
LARAGPDGGGFSLGGNPIVCIVIDDERSGTAKYIKAKSVELSAGMIIVYTSFRLEELQRSILKISATST